MDSESTGSSIWYLTKIREHVQYIIPEVIPKIIDSWGKWSITVILLAIIPDNKPPHNFKTDKLLNYTIWNNNKYQWNSE